MKMIIGYARVSTDGQTLDAQQATLKAKGLNEYLVRRSQGLLPIGRLWQRPLLPLVKVMFC